MDNKQLPPQEGHEAGYTIEEFLAVMAPVFERQQAIVDQCVAGLTVYAAGLAAKGREADVTELGYFVSGMAEFWDPDTADQHTAAYKQAVTAARDSREAPALTEQDKVNIRAGLALHARELRVTDSELEELAAECDSFAQALEGQWRAEAAPSRQASPPQQDTIQINMELGGM